MTNNVLYVIIALLIAMAPFNSTAQSRMFKYYGIEDGLASANVYLTYQDSKGYMWFATEQGLTQFDGTNYKTYTTREGLPANEVLQMCEDSVGRLWMICYSSQSCYIYNGSIHNAENDTILKHINSEGSFFRDISIDSQGGVWIYGPKVYRIHKNKVFSYKIPFNKTVIGMGYLMNQFVAVAYNGVYSTSIRNTEIDYKLLLPLDEKYQTKSVFNSGVCYLMEAGDDVRLLTIKSPNLVDTFNVSKTGVNEIVGSFSNYSAHDSLLLFASATHGIMSYSPKGSFLLKDRYNFLPNNTAYSRICFDRDGNTWISTLGVGVIFIPFNETYQYKLNKKTDDQSVTSIARLPNGPIIAGLEGSFAVLSDTQSKVYAISIRDNGIYTRKRVVRIVIINKDSLIIGTDFGLYLVNKNTPLNAKKISHECIKNITCTDSGAILVAGNTHAFVLTFKQKGLSRTILTDRRTTAITQGKDGTIWIGMLNGLFWYKEGKMERFAKSKLISNSHITDLLTDEYGNIWIATHQHGVFIINGRGTKCINSKVGLLEDACTRFFKESNGKVWICSNRHISLVTYKQQLKFIYTVSSEDGLFNRSSTINDVYVDSANIWLATSNGLLRMNRKRRTVLPPMVYITSLVAKGSFFIPDKQIKLNYFQNNIQIDYVGIAYNSPQRITYKYTLNSSDTIYTDNTSISFTSMPPGEYHLYVWAQNSPEVWSSNAAELVFMISPPFWSTWWFKCILLTILVISIWSFIRWRVARVKIYESEKTAINKKMAEAQLQALRSQINEHFIFNSLNAIQGFINQNELQSANLYLSSFGKLIRRTLDISFSTTITLQEEINYLENYLLLEKMRYEGRFYYKISNKISAIAAHDIILPSMVLQPYIENAIRHGLLHKTDGDGMLTISFYLDDSHVICSISDNGIGRKKASELKQRSSIDYQSYGINLTAERISLFNKVHSARIQVIVSDGIGGIGTQVQVVMPINPIL